MFTNQSLMMGGQTFINNTQNTQDARQNALMNVNGNVGENMIKGSDKGLHKQIIVNKKNHVRIE